MSEHIRPCEENVDLGDLLIFGRSYNAIRIREVLKDSVVAEGVIGEEVIGEKRVAIKTFCPYIRAIIRKPDETYLVGKLAERDFENYIKINERRD